MEPNSRPWPSGTAQTAHTALGGPEAGHTAIPGARRRRRRTSMSDLPLELLPFITTHLSTRCALALAATSRYHHHAITDAIYTRHIHTHRLGGTPLWWACKQVGIPAQDEAVEAAAARQRHALTTARRALRLGADPTQHLPRRRDGLYVHHEMPLLLAVQHQSAAMCALLVEYGADPCASGTTALTDTPITLAAQMGRPDVLLSLLGAGDAKTKVWPRVTNYRRSNGEAALHIAASWGHDACVRLLISYGARVDMRDGQGGTALHHAIRNGRSTTVDMLLAEYRADTLAVDYDDSNALDIATGMAYADILCRLLEVHTTTVLLPPATATKDRENWGRRAKATRLLLSDDRAHKLLVGGDGDRIPRLEAVAALIAAGINVDARSSSDEKRATALWRLVGKPLVPYDPPPTEVAELLLNAGADIEARDHSTSFSRQEGGGGQTPLLRAAEIGRSHFLAYLLARGADVTARDRGGRSVLQLAVGAEDAASSAEMTRRLLEYQQQPDGSSSGIITTLLNSEDGNGYTPLLASLQLFRHDVSGTTLRLLQAGADPEFLGKQGSTPLTFCLARIRHFVEIIDALIHHGASLDTRDATGASPLLVAASYPATLETLPWLVKRGARLNVVDTIRDSDGRIVKTTPLLKVVQRRLVDMAKVLLRAGAQVEIALECEPAMFEECRKRGDMKMLDLLEGRMSINDEDEDDEMDGAGERSIGGEGEAEGGGESMDEN